MKITETQSFDASPAELWSIIHQPGNMPAWNPKCISCESVPSGRIGQRFDVVFEMNGKQLEGLGEIVEWIENKMIRFRYFYEDAGKSGTAEEIFELFENGKRTTLKHTTDYSGVGIPLWARLLIRFITRFGKAVGPGPLDGIASLLKVNERL